MILFGIAIGVLICFLGVSDGCGLYRAKRQVQHWGRRNHQLHCCRNPDDVASGWLIDSNITLSADGSSIYDFSQSIFWIAASIISFYYPCSIESTLNFSL